MYTILYEDGSDFIGGGFEDTRWLKAPKKPIKAIRFKILNKTVILDNYEAYNFAIENSYFVKTGKNLVTKFIIMVKKEDDVLLLIFDLLKRKLLYKTAPFGKEWNKKPTANWKAGLKGLKPKTSIL